MKFVEILPGFPLLAGNGARIAALSFLISAHSTFIDLLSQSKTLYKFEFHCVSSIRLNSYEIASFQFLSEILTVFTQRGFLNFVHELKKKSFAFNTNFIDVFEASTAYKLIF